MLRYYSYAAKIVGQPMDTNILHNHVNEICYIMANYSEFEL